MQHKPGVIAARILLAVAALSAASMSFAQDAAIVRELDQNWNIQKRTDWEAAPQGSRLIPLEWLKALEQPTDEARFLAPDHMAKFRYLPQTHLSPNGLPVGFAVDKRDDSELIRTKLRWMSEQQNDAPWVGMTCAACHTAELSYKPAATAPSKTFRIYGGPALSDFQSFVDTLNEALRATRADPLKWDRFADRVLGAADNTGNRNLLKAAFAKLLDWQEREAALNKTDLTYGFGRVDAFGRIYNKTSLLTQAAHPRPNPPDAPVSIPFLWRAPQLDRVQYNGIAPKKTLIGMPFDFGALARNTGEVVGVFGDVVTSRDAGLSGFSSSIHIGNLAALEEQLMSLRPPKWPASVFGPIETALADRGKPLYERHCASCHALVDRNNLGDIIKVEMALFDGSSKFNNDATRSVSPPGTDPWMACNAYAYATSSGIFEGMPSFYVAGRPFSGEAPLSSLLTVTVVGTLLGQKANITEAAAAALFGIERRPEIAVRNIPLPNPRRSPEKAAQLERCLSDKSEHLGYTSRPLNGIWATAPYLHNGSVPTLHDLLLPPDQRPKAFNLGTREYDPKKVGYVTGAEVAGNTFTFRTRDDAGNEIDGNSNAGHDYGNARFSDEERRALVEYLKTL